MISVCIATYNGEKYIKEQLDSILCQLGAEDEIVISDDGSTDKTIEIIKKYTNNRIKLLSGNSFKNPIFNLENALKKAQGDFIFLADQDDVWLENKVQVCLKHLQNADVVVSDSKIADEKLNIMCESFFKKNNSQKGLLNNLRYNSYLGCCMAFKKNILKKALPFPKDIPMHDIWIGFVADLFYKSFFIAQPLILYRRHSKNASPTVEGSPFGWQTKLKFRWNLIKYIPLLLTR